MLLQPALVVPREPGFQLRFMFVQRVSLLGAVLALSARMKGSHDQRCSRFAVWAAFLLVLCLYVDYVAPRIGRIRGMYADGIAVAAANGLLTVSPFFWSAAVKEHQTIGCNRKRFSDGSNGNTQIESLARQASAACSRVLGRLSEQVHPTIDHRLPWNFEVKPAVNSARPTLAEVVEWAKAVACSAAVILDVRAVANRLNVADSLPTRSCNRQRIDSPPRQNHAVHINFVFNFHHHMLKSLVAWQVS